jgi:O-antigen ligase
MFNYIDKNKEITIETASAIFHYIAFVSLFILANFAAGFILPLFVLTMAVAAAIAFFYPRSGLAAIIFLTFIFERFFTLQPIVWGRAEYKLYPLDIVLITILASVVFNFLSNCYGLRSQSIRASGFAKKLGFWKRQNVFHADFYLIAFIILAVIYFFISIFILKTDFALSFSSFKHYAFYPLLFFAVAYLFNSKEKILWFFKFALAGAVGIIFFILYGLVSGAGLWSEFTPLSTEGVRTLAFPHAFYLSLTIIGLVVYISSAEYIASAKKNTVTLCRGRGIVLREVSLVVIVIWAIGIIGSMMRHLWIGLFFAFVFLLFFMPTQAKKTLLKIAGRLVFALVIFLALATYLSFLFPNSSFSQAAVSVKDVIESRAGSLFSQSEDESFSWRAVVWKEIMEEYRKNPVLGVGLGKTVYVETENYRDFVEIRNIHNSPLVVLVQMGVLGFALIFIFAASILKKFLWKKNKDWIDFSLAGIMTLYLIVFLFQPYMETNLLGIFFWIMLGLIKAANSSCLPTKYEQVRMYEKH